MQGCHGSASTNRLRSFLPLIAGCPLIPAMKAQQPGLYSRAGPQSDVDMLLQYSAASFIETINVNSLSMDPDEFVARMVAAGIPDMQLLPQPGFAVASNPLPLQQDAHPPQASGMAAFIMAKSLTCRQGRH